MELSRNSAEAEDLVQETCLRAVNRYGSPAMGASAKSWLFTILRNIWLNQLRHRRTAPDGVEFDSDGSDPNEQADAAQDPHSVCVSRIDVSRCKLRSSNFLWNSAKSSSCRI